LRAFTLIEVLISLYIAVLGVGVFYEVVYNHKKILSLKEKRDDFYLKASLIMDKEANFTIKNDSILRELKRRYKVRIKRKDFKEFFIKEIEVYNKTNRAVFYGFGIK
jgi:hypothetical protein